MEYNGKNNQVGQTIQVIKSKLGLIKDKNPNTRVTNTYVVYRNMIRYKKTALEWNMKYGRNQTLKKNQGQTTEEGDEIEHSHE